jgi:hypothetical protein
MRPPQAIAALWAKCENASTKQLLWSFGTRKTPLRARGAFSGGGCHGTLGDGSVDQRPARGQWEVYLKEAVKGAKNSQVRNEPVQVVGVAFDRIRRKTHLQISPSAPKNDSKTIPLTIQKAYHSRFISWSPICLLGSHCRAQLVRLEISDQGLRRPRNLQPEQHGEMGYSRIPLDPEVCRGGS